MRLRSTRRANTDWTGELATGMRLSIISRNLTKWHLG
jgi:hypothetical protein